MVSFRYKVCVPQRPDYLIKRSHLLEQLAPMGQQRLFCLSGPPGYGKTSLLIDFAAQSPLPVCWYTLDPSDQDLWTFLDYFVAAIEQRFPSVLPQTNGLLTGNGRTATTLIISTLTRELYAIGCDFVVVMDDWHIVDQVPEIRDAIAYILLQCPSCHMVLASRTYPSLPNMMLLTARRQMSSMNESQLRFSAPEAAAVLQSGYGTTISPEQAAMMVEQSNGWITGILLAFQTFSRYGMDHLSTNLYTERQVYRFLVEQVFDMQPPEIRSFLLDSSLVEELSAESCDAIFQRQNSRQLLEQLVRNHLFVNEIRPGTLIYHPPFREFLQEHYRAIDFSQYQHMVTQVANFYAAQGQWLLAFDRYIAISDDKAAQHAIAHGGQQLYLMGRLETLDHWFAALSEDDLDAQLLCLKARVKLDLGDEASAQVLASMAELRAGPDERLMTVLLQAQIARIVGNYDRALDLAEQVRHTAQDPAQIAAALRTIGICHHRLGQIEHAINDLEEALAIERSRCDLYAAAQLQRDLGMCYRDRGMLHAAIEYYTQADTYWTTINNLALRAMSLNSKGGVQHLTGRYLDAHATLTMALQYAREGMVPHYQATVLSSFGDLYSDLRLWERASAAYDEARKIGGSAYLMSCLDTAHIRLFIRQKQYEAAGRELRALPLATRRYHPNDVTMLSATVACGIGQYAQAKQELQQLIAQLQPDKHPMDVARAYLTAAFIAASTPGEDHQLVVELLDRALGIAELLGHDTFLMIEAMHMHGLLRRADAAGWSRANLWLQRQHDMLLTAKMLAQDDQRPILTVRALGVDQILLDSQPIEIGWSKAREVFYYLLAHPQGVPIETLREVIWPNLPLERSRDTLRTAIYELRSALPRDLIVLHGRQFYRINRDVAQMDYDVEQFLETVATRSDDLEQLLPALDLYRGPFLVSSDSEWCVAQRTQLEQHYLRMLHLAAADAEQERDTSYALALFQRILVLDSFDEAAHAGIMRCHIELGNRAAAIQQYQTLRRILDEELGLDPLPSSEVEHLYRRLLMA